MIKIEFKAAPEQRVIGYDLLNDRDLLSSVVDDSQYERHLKIKKQLDSKQAK